MAQLESFGAIEAVRRRPGMYFGNVHDGTGLHHLVWEVVANTLDQVLAGHATTLDLVMHTDGSVSVRDDGVGMVVDDPGAPSFLETVLTTIHYTATADGHAPHVHLGRQGLGLAAVCALCERLEVDVFRAGAHSRQSFARGARTSDCVTVGPTSERGTLLRMWPDPEIFPWNVRFDAGALESRLRELSFLWPGLRTSFTRERVGFGPSPDLLALHAPSSRLRHATALAWESPEGALTARVAMGFYAPSLGRPRIHTYANLEATQDGGTHEVGFCRGVGRALAPLDPLGSHPRSWKRRFERVSPGLVAVVSVNLVDPHYGEPTKSRLESPEAEGVVEELVHQGLARALEEDRSLREHVAECLSSPA